MTDANTIPELNIDRPQGNESMTTSDDYHREIRRVLKGTFPNVNGRTNVTVQNLNDLINATSVIVRGSIVKRDGKGEVLGNVTGNAASATILEVARSIAGVPFDGSANIDIGINNLSGISGLTADDLNRLVGLAQGLDTDTLLTVLTTLRSRTNNIPTAATQESSTNTANFVTPALLATALAFLDAIKNAEGTSNTQGIGIDTDGDVYVYPAGFGVSGEGTSTLTLPENYRDFDILSYSMIRFANPNDNGNQMGTVDIRGLSQLNRWQKEGYTFSFDRTARTISIVTTSTHERFNTARLYRFS